MGEVKLVKDNAIYVRIEKSSFYFCISFIPKTDA